MSSTPTADLAHTATLEPTQAAPSASSAPLLIAMPSMTADTLQKNLAVLEAALGGLPLLVASPDVNESSELAPGAKLIPYAAPSSGQAWVLDAQDFAVAGQLASEHNASGVILLGGDPGTLEPQPLRAMADALRSGADLALPRYKAQPHDGMVNSALLFPMCRALFGIDVRSPLPRDAGLSTRAATRLASAARRSTQTGGNDALLWPVGETAIAGFSVREVDGGPRLAPRPPEAEFNALFTGIIASLFTDIEQKAAYWQRARSLPVPLGGLLAEEAPPSAIDLDEIKPLVDDFRNAFLNLREIWMLVLPPQSLVQLKRLSQTAPGEFALPANLWARTVYDFALAYRQRTLNRGHLLGALTPLYLAWVASFLRLSGDDEAAADRLITTNAAAFEQEKPYFIARWRSPDRFNP